MNHDRYIPSIKNINSLLLCNLLNGFNFEVLDRLSRIVVADMTVLWLTDLKGSFRLGSWMKLNGYILVVENKRHAFNECLGSSSRQN